MAAVRRRLPVKRITRSRMVKIRDLQGIERKVDITIFPPEVRRTVIRREGPKPVDTRTLRLTNAQIEKLKNAFR